MPIPSVLGLDASLTSTGYAYIDSYDKVRIGCIKPRTRGAARLAFIRDSVKELITRAAPDLVSLEGYAMGFNSGKSRLFDIGELGGVLRLLVWECKIPLLIVPPSTLKQFITGNGAAKKFHIRAALRELYSIDIDQDDQADAYALLKYGEGFLQPIAISRNISDPRRLALGKSVLYSQ